MIRRTLMLELESGRTLKLKGVEGGVEMTLGKAQATFTDAEVAELQGALREVGGAAPVQERVQRTQPPKQNFDFPLNPQ